MTYYKYETKNPKIKKMLLSLAKHTGVIKGVHDIDFAENEKTIGLYYQSEYYDIFIFSRVRGYVKDSLVDACGKDVTLEEIITFILEGK